MALTLPVRKTMPYDTFRMTSIRHLFTAISAELPQSPVLIGLLGWFAFIFLFILPTIIIVTTIGGV